MWVYSPRSTATYCSTYPVCCGGYKPNFYVRFYLWYIFVCIRRSVRTYSSTYPTTTITFSTPTFANRLRHFFARYSTCIAEKGGANDSKEAGVARYSPLERRASSSVVAVAGRLLSRYVHRKRGTELQHGSVSFLYSWLRDTVCSLLRTLSLVLCGRFALLYLGYCVWMCVFICSRLVLHQQPRPFGIHTSCIGRINRTGVRGT